MALRCTPGQTSGLLCISFNQDNSCIALGTADGARIYNIDTHKVCYRSTIGAIG
jgi:autophagy-related protein 18